MSTREHGRAAKALLRSTRMAFTQDLAQRLLVEAHKDGATRAEIISAFATCFVDATEEAKLPQEVADWVLAITRLASSRVRSTSDTVPQ